MVVLLSHVSVSAQVRFNTPVENEELLPGDLFVSISVPSGRAFQLWIDKDEVTGITRNNDGQLSILWQKPLMPGKHMLRLNLKAVDGNWESYQSGFNIIEPMIGVNVDSADVIKKKWLEGKASMQGSISFETRQTLLDGPGKALRQEPSQTNFLFINTSIQTAGLKIPIRFTGTSDEFTYTAGNQSKNFFQTGVQARKWEVLFGDVNPSFDRLVFTGTRVHGISASLNLKRFRFSAVYGYLNRPLEGQLLRYSFGDGLPPPNLNTDSTYVKAGIYQRNVLAMRFEIGSTLHGKSKTGITLLKAKDDTSSIRYGAEAADNIAAAIDHSQKFFKNRLKVNAGLAVSFLTKDSRLGVVTKARIDSLLQTRFPFEPSDVKNIIVINASTTGNTPAVYSGYINVGMKFKKHDLYSEFFQVGSAFSSLANPFLRNDQRQWMFSDRFEMFERKLFGSVRYQYITNNLSNNQITRFDANQVNLSLLYSKNANAVKYSLNQMVQFRISTPSSQSINGSVDERLITTSLGISHQFNFAGINHFINGQINYSQRNDFIRTGNTNGITNFGFLLNEKFNFPLSVDISYQFIDNKFMYFNANNNSNQQISLQANWEFPDYGWTCALGFGQTNVKTAFGTSFYDQSNRNRYYLRAGCSKIKNLQVDIEAGSSPFTSNIHPDNNYTEAYFYTRLTYTFSGKNMAGF
jgi:hypothetical protein